MEIKKAVQERIAQIEKEKEQLLKVLDIYGTPETDLSKSDQYKHLVRELISQHKAWHMNDFQEEFTRRGIDFNKGIMHQCLNTLRHSGEVIAIKINGSNQKYFYMNAVAKSDTKLKVNEDYLPMPIKYIEDIEVM